MTSTNNINKTNIFICDSKWTPIGWGTNHKLTAELKKDSEIIVSEIWQNIFERFINVVTLGRYGQGHAVYQANCKLGTPINYNLLNYFDKLNEQQKKDNFQTKASSSWETYQRDVIQQALEESLANADKDTTCKYPDYLLLGIAGRIGSKFIEMREKLEHIFQADPNFQILYKKTEDEETLSMRSKHYLESLNREIESSGFKSALGYDQIKPHLDAIAKEMAQQGVTSYCKSWKSQAAKKFALGPVSIENFYVLVLTPLILSSQQSDKLSELLTEPATAAKLEAAVDTIRNGSPDHEQIDKLLNSLGFGDGIDDSSTKPKNN